VQQSELIPLGEDWDGRLEEWLEMLGEHEPYDPEEQQPANSWSFPTDSLLKEYLANIDSRPAVQLLHLLRCFLFENVTFGSDFSQLEVLSHFNDSDALKRFRASEYGQRLLHRPEMAHPGVRWVLDLLPSNPQHAINVIDAYVTAYGFRLPDGRLSGLWDASALISARYMSRKSPDGTEALRGLTPRQLEQLVARLYTEMGYECELTPPTKDGGWDVSAKAERPGQREYRVIDCAHYTGTVPIMKVRAILGVANKERATSAVLLTTGRISRTARAEAAGNSKVDLVDGERLVELLDQHLGVGWPSLIDYWIQWPPRS
jgi:restriction system protein